MRCFKGVLLGGLIAISAAANADQTYVKAGVLLDVETGKLKSNQAILIEDGKIVKVGPATQLAMPDDARLVDLSDYTVLPGLMDAHTHFFADADDQGYRSIAISLPTSVIKGVKNAAITLEAGFTTVRTVGAPGFADVALRDAIASGDVIGPRMLVAGPPIGITGGHCSDDNFLPAEYDRYGDGVADGPWAVRAMVRKNIKYGVDLIKTCSTGGVLSKGTKVGASQYTIEELKALVHEAHMHGRKVASHAHGAEGIKKAIIAGVDSVEHASFIDDEGIELAKEYGTALVMDIYVTEYIQSAGADAGFTEEGLAKDREVGDTQRANFTKAHNAGVNIVFGTDSAVYPHGQNARQFSRMVRFGMTPLEAIQSATVEAAKLLGVEGEVGLVKEGFLADLIAVKGNPLEDISLLEEVKFVMKAGAVIKNQK